MKQLNPARGLWLAAMVVAIATSFSASPGGSQTKKGAEAAKPSSLTPEQRQRNLESFEVVWRTIRDKHWDAKLGGLNWQAVHDELRPEVEKATTAAQCRKVLNDMIHRLGQSHFAIIPADAYREITKGSNPKGKTASAEAPSGAGVPGFTVRIVDGQAMVVQVQEGLPAAKLGVLPGWQIVRIGDEDLAPALTKIRESNKGSAFLDGLLNRAVLGRLRGKVGGKLTIVSQNGQGQEVSLPIVLAEPSGVPVRFGNLPTFFVSFESRKVAGNIAYFSLTAFFDPVHVMKALEDTVKANLNADGFVLDLRGNPGGLGAMAMGVGNWFVEEPNQKLGTLFTRESSFKFTLSPRAETFRGPLAILVDSLSASTSEILTGGLQDLKRAKVFGARTAGAALPSVVVRLPNGDGFQYAMANYVSEGGKVLEGRGVRPDVEVPLRRQSLLKGEDAVLNAAVEWIHAQKKSSTG
jgi:carboxyl-terminal processing protease